MQPGLILAGSQVPAPVVIQQVQASQKSRTHFGRDAESRGMDGNQQVVQVLDSNNLQTRSLICEVAGTSVVAPVCHPWTLDFGIPAENTCV